MAENTSREPRFDVLWPLSSKAKSGAAAAPRLADLNGKTICELSDMLFGGETIYPLVREHIRALFPGVRFVEYSEFGAFYSGEGARESALTATLPERLRRHGCDAVIAGIGG